MGEPANERDAAMDKSFEDRVKRLFGSDLFKTVPESSFPASSWSVAVGEVERQEWNRERGVREEREDDPCSSAFYDKDGCLLKSRRSRRDKQREFEGDLGDLDGDEERDEEKKGVSEEEEIRFWIGRDPTLDNEDEEDEYDKAALCRENANERVYMKDVKDHGPFMNYHAVVPDFLDEPSDDASYFKKDPCADRNAAYVRLKEDKKAAVGGPTAPVWKSGEPSSELPIKLSENDINVKPILKRKDVQADPKPKKRVRFDPEYIDDHDEVSEEPQDVPTLPKSLATREPEESPGIPDYLRNPSKYTYYSLDSSEGCDEETNKRAFLDFRNLVKSSEPDDLKPECPVELPKSVTFTPRKKSVDVVPMDDSPMTPKQKGLVSACSGGIAAGEANESGACEMDEDDVETPSADIKISARKVRQYRPKSPLDDFS